MKKLFLIIVGLLLIPAAHTMIRADNPTILSQIMNGAAIGTGTGISLGLLNKYSPRYNKNTFLLMGLVHNTLVREAHQNDAGIMLDVSAMLALVTWFVAINKSEFSIPISADSV